MYMACIFPPCPLQKVCILQLFALVTELFPLIMADFYVRKVFILDTFYFPYIITFHSFQCVNFKFSVDIIVNINIIKCIHFVKVITKNPSRSECDPNLTNFTSFCVIRVNDVQVRCCHHREYEHHLSVPTSQK